MELMIGDENIYLRKRSYRRYYVIVGVLAALTGFLVGILIGRYGIPRGEETPTVPLYAKHEGGQQLSMPVSRPGISAKFDERISADNIRRYLRNITARPHLAGTADSENLARQLAHFWRDLGLDEVKLTPYNIPIPRPDHADPNSVQFLDNEKNVVFTSSPVEKTLTEQDNIDLAAPPFHGFSPAGDVVGDLVYANYGRFEDFHALTVDMAISLTGKIVLARYGKIFRGDIVNLAQRFGAAGVIIYSDPIDYTWGEHVYPKDWWLPGSAVQRGVVSRSNGDPRTPGYPSIGSAYRLPKNFSISSLPTIPSQPIGYNDAQFLLRQMKGTVAPEKWRGGLNLTYRLGGLNQGQVRLHVTNKNERHTVYNVIGIIRGSVEPDRYVIIGNHRDAWGYGAFDPGSGSAVLKELSRVYATMVKEDWRPRRSLVFCSWGAEEIGLVGSTEWVEQFAKVLNDRAVAYMNIDTAVQGNYTLEGNSSPLLYAAMYEATKMVPNPDAQERTEGLETVYDKWLKVFPWRFNETDPHRPKLRQLGAASDYTTFYQRLGIPAIDVHYVYNKDRIKGIAYHPLYHTAYDTFYSFQAFADPDFQISKTMAHVFAETSKLLVDSTILPFNVRDYAAAITKFTHDIIGKYGVLLEKEGGISLGELSSAAQRFQQEAKDFHLRVESINKSSPLLVRMVNDQLMQIERAFMDPAGLPGRPLSRHVVYAPSAVDSYAGSSFPGLTDALFELNSAVDRTAHWEIIKQQWAVVTYTVLSAASTLRDVTNFMSDYFV